MNRTLAALALHLGIITKTLPEDKEPGSKDLPEQQIVSQVRAELEHLPPGTLWVVDNLPYLAMARELARDAAPLRLVITSRDSRAGSLPFAFATVLLQPLEPQPAIALLCSRAGTHAGPDDPAVAALAERVGYLPLALEALAVRLATGRTTATSLLAEIDAAPNRVQLDAFRRGLAEAGANIDRPESVFTVLEGALAALPPDVRSAIAPLGYLADAPISDALLAALTGEQGDRLDDFIEICRGQSLLTWSAGQTTVHALTTALVAATSSAGALAHSISQVRARLDHIAANDPVAFRGEQMHFEQLLGWARGQLGPEDEQTLGFAHSLARGYRALGWLERAIRLDEQTLRIAEPLLGPEHRNILMSRNNLAIDYG
ncbi:MAG: tetratricopeptide repeat protein, partial [Chloroflexota bacterium]